MRNHDPLKIVLFNGPPRVGKDYAAEALCQEYFGAVHVKFAGPLKRATHEAFGLSHPADYYEDCKDKPHSDFNGLSPRAAYILMSEKGIKPTFGDAHFGRAAANRLRAMHTGGLKLAVISDSGFLGEARELVWTFGAQHILILELSRQGCTFEGDSRSYIGTELSGIGVAYGSVFNYGDVSFGIRIAARVKGWLRSAMP